MNTLSRRVKRLEVQHTAPNVDAQIATAADAFYAKFGDLIERTTEAGPGDSLATQIACQVQSDPTGALARLHQAATDARLRLETDPQYRRWRYGRA